ncbi:GNAT family N-acetyltransferase [Variovorax sp. OV329]|uniref:GNAT family N-acetyltransferase n=1 Tax=Variovorax sp. OV329 TaxID=1882825 RepID=UPI0008E37F7C|nr:GNAT family protein [Variovorax sp. OV329]SFM83001.1 Protein N-acetyltransferase, RimJ/RimL family [Variovorax sp. OV329]
MPLPLSLTLRDARRVTVREIRPEDREGLHAAVLSLSPDARYTRFMTAVRDLPEHTYEAATHPEPQREFALVVLPEEGEARPIVAGARYASAAGSDCCEFAITILDDWQGQGLSTPLMNTLIDAARAHGFRTMEGYVLSANAPMRRLAKRLGFSESACPDDASTRIVKLALAKD